ncbi:MAG: glutamate racemase [Marinilabiliaceae bacterium]
MDSSQKSIPGPIGVFDSGYGGLTILDEFLKTFPDYDFIYLGDNARTPYGTRSFDVVYHYTLESVHKLFEMGVHLVILACNTASAKALRSIQEIDLPRYGPDRRVLGVVRPSAEEVGKMTKNRHIGIVGTTGTVQSFSYPMEIEKLHPDTLVTQQACPMWVPLVENGEIHTEGAAFFVKRDLEKLFEKDPHIDTLVLGCTHYPLLLEQINNFIPRGVEVMSQGPVVAASLRDYLRRHPEMDARCSKEGECRFYTTEHPHTFNEASALFLKRRVESVRLS